MVLKEWAEVWKLYKDGYRYLTKTLEDRSDWLYLTLSGNSTYGMRSFCAV